MPRTTFLHGTARSLLLATILGAGVLAIWLFLFVAVSLVSTMFLARDWRQLSFTVEGEPMWEYRAGTSSEANYRTLDGKAVENPRSLDFASIYSQHELPAEKRRWVTRVDWRERLRGFYQPEAPTSYWYLVHDGQPDGSAYLAGYDPVTRRLIGYLGKAGFTPDVPRPADQFRVSIRNLMSNGFVPRHATLGAEPQTGSDNFGPVQYLLADGEFWALDLKQQSVTEVPMPGEVLSVSTYDELSRVDDERHFSSKLRMVMRFADELGLYDLQAKPLATIKLPAEVRDAALSLVRTTKDQILLIASPEDYSGKRELYWYDSTGQIVRHETTEPIYPPSKDQALASWVMSAALPSPGLLAGISFLVADTRSGWDATAYWKAFGEFWSYLWLPYLLLSLVSLASAIYCYRRQQASGSGGAAAWAVFVFLTGVPGLIGYLVHRNWPVQVSEPRASISHGIEVFA